MDPKAEQIFRDIRDLKVQGAQNVADAAIEALLAETRSYKAKDRLDFLEHMRSTMLWLKWSRPTEPALRNALRFIFARTRASKKASASELVSLVEREAAAYRKNVAETRERISRYGARLIPQDATVLTHCHSGSVVGVIKAAFDQGKNPSVICTETRPLYQGRITAKQLSEHGIKTTFIVDNASNYMLTKMRDTDVVLVGADAVTSAGDLINKIGTSLIAIAAFEHGKRFYSCTGTHKYDPVTLWGEQEPIEQRSPDEVISKAEMPNVEILNPAFDLTLARYLTAYVTEFGVIPPQGLTTTVWQELGLEKEEKE
jgi:ribose 1,5-bisphosphate isomerase